MVGGIHKDHTLEEVAKERWLDHDGAQQHRGYGQQNQGDRHHRWGLMRFVMVIAMVAVVVLSVVISMIVSRSVFAPARLAVEDHEKEPKAVKRGHKHTQQQHVIDHLSRGLI